MRAKKKPPDCLFVERRAGRLESVDLHYCLRGDTPLFVFGRWRRHLRGILCPLMKDRALTRALFLEKIQHGTDVATALIENHKIDLEVIQDANV